MFRYLDQAGKGIPCTQTDIASGNMVDTYWTGDFTPSILGLQKVFDTGKVLNYYSCDVDGCNKPGLAPQGTCMAVKSTWSSGYCAGKSIYTKICVPILSDPTTVLINLDQLGSPCPFPLSRCALQDSLLDFPRVTAVPMKASGDRATAHWP